jgi:hypothetical protein
LSLKFFWPEKKFFQRKVSSFSIAAYSSKMVFFFGKCFLNFNESGGLWVILVFKTGQEKYGFDKR